MKMTISIVAIMISIVLSAWAQNGTLPVEILSGNLSGAYSASGVELRVSGTLVGDTTIEVRSGRIVVVSPGIWGGSSAGNSGASGTSLSPSGVGGSPASSSYSLTLSTLPGRLAIPGTGDIVFSTDAAINLVGRNGGSGGDGFAASLSSPPNACNLINQAGAGGGSGTGGNGGSLSILAARHVELNVGTINTSGGQGGNGGSGGNAVYQIGSIPGNGQVGGSGGSAGSITISAQSELRLGISTISSYGGPGGAGGASGSEGDIQRSGTQGGSGRSGGVISLSAPLITSDVFSSNGAILVSNIHSRGGIGGNGGRGGDSRSGYSQCFPMITPTCDRESFAGSGPTVGGGAGSSGLGGEVTLVAGTINTPGISIECNGAFGNAPGPSGVAGYYVTCPTEGVGCTNQLFGAFGLPGSGGNTGGKIHLEAQTLSIPQSTFTAVGGGGSAGAPAGGLVLQPGGGVCGYSCIGLNGGSGGSGGSGGNGGRVELVVLGTLAANTTNVSVFLNGGNGGAGGTGGTRRGNPSANGGAGGGGGPPGKLSLSGPVTIPQSQIYQSNGVAGAYGGDGTNCP